MRLRLQAVRELGAKTFSSWQEDRAPRLAASLAYYTMFSLAPLLIIAIAVAGFAFGREAAQGQVAAQVQQLVGPQAGQAVQTMIQNAGNHKSGIVASLVGVVVLIVGATGVFGELQDSLNTIWEVKPKPGRGIRGLVRDRFLSFAMVMGIAFLLLVSLVISTLLAGLGKVMGGMMPGMIVLSHALNLLISLGVITLLFAMMFKLLPDAKVAWGDVWVGALLTALLFTVGKALLGLYLGYSSTGSVFGAAGSLVVLLIWVYYSAQILFLGAEFTKAYARWRGTHTVPAENAVAISEVERLQRGMVRPGQLQAAAEQAGSRPENGSPRDGRGGRGWRWAALLVGFGAAGAMARRRRVARVVLQTEDGRSAAALRDALRKRQLRVVAR